MTDSRGEGQRTRPEIRLADLGSGQMTTRVFAVPSRPPRFRRPTDVVLLVLALVVIAVTAWQVERPADFEKAFATWLSTLPQLFDFLWSIAFDFAQVWVVLIAVLASVRRRWTLLRDWAVSLALTVAGVLFVGWAVDGSLPTLSDSIGPADGSGGFPSLALAASAAAISVANPYLVSPLRKCGRWLIGLAWLSALVLGVAAPGAALCAIAIGWAAGAFVHLAFGSPDGTPSLHDLGESLRSIGVDAVPTSVEVSHGVALARAKTPDDRELDVHIHGRDSWDSQFFVKTWRLVFYRSGGRNVTVNRRHQVEHQAFLTLFAEREGASVTPLVVAAMDSRGDALFVAERMGPGFTRGDDEISDELVADAWRSLALLHDAGIRHGGITPDHLRVAHGCVYLADFDRATIDWDDTSRQFDQAQLLTSTAVTVGAERAVAAASAALGVERLTEMTTFVQAAAMTPALRKQAAAADLDIDDLRKATIAEVGAEEQELQTLRRISLGNVVMMVLLIVVAYSLIGTIQSVGLSSIVDSITAASSGCSSWLSCSARSRESPARSRCRELRPYRFPLPG